MQLIVDVSPGQVPEYSGMAGTNCYMLVRDWLIFFCPCGLGVLVYSVSLHWVSAWTNDPEFASSFHIDQWARCCQALIKSSLQVVLQWTDFDQDTFKILKYYWYLLILLSYFASCITKITLLANTKITNLRDSNKCPLPPFGCFRPGYLLE